MKKIGIIMEVNPFHNGHKYFLEEVKKKAKDNYIICVITTTITQRGEVSILPKEIKTELLLEYGVDLVVELPTLMSNQGGKFYGYYNIKVLNDLGVDAIMFGSESGDVNSILQQINNEKTKKDFSKGYLKEQIGLLQSNDILGMSYMKAIAKINPNIRYKAIKRIDSQYNDKDIKDNKNKICSASAIRKNLNKKEKLKHYLPTQSLDNIKEIDEMHLIKILLFQLLNNTNDKQIFLSENGQMISKIKKTFERLQLSKNIEKYTLSTLAEECSDKNNSKYKMRRIFVNIIFQITTKEAEEYIRNCKSYKVLGFRERYAKEIKDNPKLFLTYKKRDPIYTINDKVDKILDLYYTWDFKFNYNKPIIK